MAAFNITPVNYAETHVDNGFGLTVKYDLSFLNNRVEVDLRVALTGTNPGAALLATWQNGINTIWNQKVFFADANRLYEVTVDFDFVSSGQHQTVAVHAGSGRADMGNFYIDDPHGVAMYDEVVAHEIGHMLGNFDEYAGGGTHNNFVRTGTLMSDLTVAGFQDYFWSIEQMTERYSGLTLSTQLARVGGEGADTLTGTAGKDGFYGNGGNDTISGLGGADYIVTGAGDDTVVYSPGGGADIVSDFVAGANTVDKIDLRGFTTLRSVNDVLTGTTQVGADSVINFGNGDTLTLLNVNKAALSVSDFIFNAAANRAPVAAIGDHSVAANQFVRVAPWMSYGDADGNPATFYAFSDGGTGATSGYFWTPTNAHHPAGTTITVAAADINNVWVRGGQGAGAETMYVAAFDGTAWSAWDSFTLTTSASTARPYVAEAQPAGSQIDFNGDGHADLLFTSGHSLYEWQMNDRAISAQGGVDGFDPAFTRQITGDFDGDGKSDVLLSNPTTGGVWELQLNGTGIKTQGAVDVADKSFHMLGAGDFDGNGTSDVIWRNDAGFIYMWKMNGLDNTPAAVGALSPQWKVQGAGDFDGDGNADLLLRNASSTADNGAFFLWKMDGNQIIGQSGIERPSSAWKTLGLGDFDGDGKMDFAVRNVSNTADNGAVWVYLMDGSTIKAQGAAGIANAATWDVAEIGDLNADGRDDILFRNDAGYFYSWDMDGTHIASEGAAGTQANNWAHPSLQVVSSHWELV